MNIRVVHSWLKEYLESEISAEKLADYLSLCGPSVEKVEKIAGEEVLEIEITSNRIDTASILGIAQESYAILPEFGIKAKFKDKFENFDYKTFKNQLAKKFSFVPEIEVFYPAVRRYLAVLIENVKIGPAPEFIRKRLELSGIKSINNVVDISNYVMLELGQPNHFFDYDELNGKLVLKEAKKGEKIKILDEREVELEKGDLIFLDGKGRLTDLCGIMGGYYSEVREKTSRILVTVPVYDKKAIRRTSMRTAIRTVAATYFEKGLDEERSELALKLLLDLLEKYADAKVSSQVFDYYPKKVKPKKVEFTVERIEKLIGVKISEKRILGILRRLGFKVEKEKEKLIATPPYWRKYDIENVNDIVEEIARIYGYHNLPSKIQPIILLKQPKQIELLFKNQLKIKKLLKHLGFVEVMNYSMTSEEIIDKYIPQEKDKHLKLKNPISQLLVYMRRYLFPSLAENIRENKANFENLSLFELVKVYHKRKGDLPEEIYHLALATTKDFYYLKGIVETVFDELNIEEVEFSPSKIEFLERGKQAEIRVKNETIGFIGKLKKEDIYVSELDFEKMISFSKPQKTIKPLPKYAVIKLDYNFLLSQDLNYQKIEKKAFESSPLLYKIEVVDIYQNKLTLRFYFTDYKKNLTEEEAKEELRKILENLGVEAKI